MSEYRLISPQEIIEVADLISNESSFEQIRAFVRDWYDDKEVDYIKIHVEDEYNDEGYTWRINDITPYTKEGIKVQLRTRLSDDLMKDFEDYLEHQVNYIRRNYSQDRQRTVWSTSFPSRSSIETVPAETPEQVEARIQEYLSRRSEHFEDWYQDRKNDARYSMKTPLQKGNQTSANYTIPMLNTEPIQLYVKVD